MQPFKSFISLHARPRLLTTHPQYHVRRILVLHAPFAKDQAHEAILSRLRHYALPSAEQAYLSIFDPELNRPVKNSLTEVIKHIQPFHFLSTADTGVHRILPLAPITKPEAEIKKKSLVFKRNGRSKAWHFHAEN